MLISIELKEMTHKVSLSDSEFLTESSMMGVSLLAVTELQGLWQ
jgi:hypothetical protein